MSAFESNVVTRQVRDARELQQALELVHENYVRCGYMEPAASGLRIHKHYALPSTRTFVATLRDQVISTVSLFFDSKLKLPLDDLYGDKLDPFRKAGLRIVEVGMLADRREALTRGLDMVLRLMKHAFWEAASQGAQEMVIVVNPRHAAFYSRLLCFETLGDERSYQSVGGAPAVLLRLNLERVSIARVDNPRIRRTFFTPFGPFEDTRAGYSMQAADLVDFFVDKSDVFSSLTDDQRALVEAHYPGLDIASLLERPQHRRRSA